MDIENLILRNGIHSIFLKLSKVEKQIKSTISKKRSKSKMAKLSEIEKESKKQDGNPLHKKRAKSKMAELSEIEKES